MTRSLTIARAREPLARCAPLLAAAALGALGPLVGLANGGFSIEVAAPIAILGLVAAATLLAVHPPLAPRSGPALLVLGALGGLVLVMALSLAWSPYVDLGWLIATKGLVYLVVVLLAAMSIRSVRSVVAAVVGLAAGGVVLAAVTLVRIASAADPRADFFDSRLAGTVGYQNGLAAVLLASALALLAGAALPVRSAGGVALRAGAGAALGLVAVTALGAQSRGALLGAIVGVGVLLAAAPTRLRMLPALGALGVALATSYGAAGALREGVIAGASEAASAADAFAVRGVVVMLALGLVGAVHGLLELRLARHDAVRRWAVRTGVAALAAVGLLALALGVVRSGDIAQDAREAIDSASVQQEASTDGQRLISISSSGRIALWEAALDALGDRPLVGQGGGGYAIWWSSNRPAAITDTLFAHSLPLAVAAEQGLVGLALLAAWLAGIGWALVRLRRGRESRRSSTALLGALVTAWLVSTSVDWFWSLPTTTLPAMVAVGALAGLSAGPLARGAHAITRRRRIAVGAVVAVGTLAGVAFVAPPLLADRALDRAAARGVSDPEGARADISRAEAIYPHDMRIDQLRARLSFASGDLERARRELVEGTRRVPRLHQTWTRLADFDEFVARDPGRALPSLRRALVLHRADSRLRNRIVAIEESLERDPG